MKPTLNLALILLLLLFEGCITAPLNIQNHAQQLEATFDFEAANVRFLNYCFFNIAPTIEWETFAPLKGIIALTDTHLFLATGNSKNATDRKLTKIPIPEIDGISIMPREIQFRHDGQLFVVVLYRWYDLKIAPTKSWEIYELLASMNVPQFEASETHSMYGSRTRPPDHGEPNGGSIENGMPQPARYERFPNWEKSHNSSK